MKDKNVIDNNPFAEAVERYNSHIVPKTEKEIITENITCFDFNTIEKQQAERADCLDKFEKDLNKKHNQLNKEAQILNEKEKKLRQREEPLRKRELQSEFLDKEIDKKEKKLEDLEGKLKEIEIEMKAKELLNSQISIIDSESSSRFKNTMTLSNQVLKELRQVKLQNEEMSKEYNDGFELMVDAMEELKSQALSPKAKAPKKKMKSAKAKDNLNNSAQLEFPTVQTEEEKYRSKLLDNYSFKHGKTIYYLSFVNTSIEQYENEMLDLYVDKQDVGETRIWVQELLLSEPTPSDPFGNSLGDPFECSLKTFPEIQEDFNKAFGIS